MTAPAELLRELSAAGIEVRRDGDSLRVRAPKGRVTPDLIDRLRAEKQELLAELSRPPRAIVRFRLRAKDGWATALGAPGNSADDVIADLRERHGDGVQLGRVIEGRGSC
jgi:hypothetical protein